MNIKKLQEAPAPAPSSVKNGPASTIHPHADHVSHTTFHHDCSQCREGMLRNLAGLGYLGIVEKHNPVKGGPKFWSVSPSVASSLDAFVGFAGSDRDRKAERIVRALNIAEESYVVYRITRDEETVYRVAAPDEPLTGDGEVVAHVAWGDLAALMVRLLNESNASRNEPAPGKCKEDRRVAPTSLYSDIADIIKQEVAADVLTLQEAVIQDANQLESTNRLTKKMFRRGLTDIWKYLSNYDPNDGQSEGPEKPDPLAE